LFSLPRPPPSPPFPYTTLFRSLRVPPVTASPNQTRSTKVACLTSPSNVVREGTSARRACSSVMPLRQVLSSRRCSSRNTSSCDRSEEHTSELQSLRHLVCRLLL